MSKLDMMKDRQFVFGSIHIIANKKETLMERELKEHGITFKQWFLMAVIRHSFEEPPTLNETAKAMGSSHQNVKKIAVNLETKGFLTLEKDKRDSRVTRIHLTKESDKLAASTEAKAAVFTSTLFDGIDAEHMEKTRIVLQRMMENLSKMEQ
jgi:DNA-binding MarR family transcriptional regulator